ncbi:COMMD10 [Cordylochernes scorpioides]|uniref:COMMD10 n=1 Tax=Cordylochernes scorpioides TaxID=51811 RepID=A0ABY6L6W2_9ARAC|nr:COMMD10 [Cordylochernes scorpioides]
MFSNTPQLRQAVGLINNLDDDKFPLLLLRILQKLHLKGESFTSEEESKLRSSLDLEPDQLVAVLNTLTYFLQQAAFHLAKPGMLAQSLAQIDLSPEKDCTTLEQHAVIRFLNAEGIQPSQICQRMKNIYGESYLSQKNIYKWVNEFKNGRITCTDTSDLDDQVLQRRQAR